MLSNNILPVIVWALLILCNAAGMTDLSWWVVLAPGWLVGAIPLVCFLGLYLLRLITLPLRI